MIMRALALIAVTPMPALRVGRRVRKATHLDQLQTEVGDAVEEAVERRLIGDVPVQHRLDRAYVDAQAVEGEGGLFAHSTFDPDLVAFRGQLVPSRRWLGHCPAVE